MDKVTEKLKEHVEQIAKREMCFLYDLEWVGQGNGRTLRVFIDKEGEEGVSIDDCSKVSRGLDLVLDIEELVPGGAYQLEVSSPGLERRLSQPWHFEKASGELAQFQLNQALGDIMPNCDPKSSKRKKLTGVIVGNDDQGVKVIVTEEKQLTEGKEEVVIPFKCIHKSRVVYTYETNFVKKKPKKTGKG